MKTATFCMIWKLSVREATDCRATADSAAKTTSLNPDTYGIKVNTTFRRFTDTSLADPLLTSEDSADKIITYAPQRHLGIPEEHVKPAMQPLFNRASCHTGTALEVNNVMECTAYFDMYGLAG